jgi:hypothetical protein
VFFVATGITDGELLRGVRYRSETATTDSIVMRSKSGTVRRIDSTHRLSKLRAYSSIDFEKAKELRPRTHAARPHTARAPSGAERAPLPHV